MNSNDDSVFDGLYESISRTWADHYDNILKAPFRLETWKSNFETLGVSKGVITMIQIRIDELELEYTSSLVWKIFEMESTGNLASMVLDIELQEFSYARMRLRGNDTDEENDEETDEEREDTPCPTGSQGQTFMAMESSTSDEMGDIGNSEELNEEQDRNNGGEDANGFREDNSSGAQGGGDDLGDSNEEESEDENEESSSEKTRTVESDHQFRKFIIATDRHAKQRRITIHFLGNPPLTSIPEFLPPLEAIDNPAQENIHLFHGCPVMETTSDNLNTILNSFLTNGPIIFTNLSSIAKPSYLSRKPAVYYSTSIAYGRIWPQLKKGFATYRQIRKLGTEFTLIAVSKVSRDVFNGNMADVMCARIPQSNPDLAKKASSSDPCSLMFEQFANRNMSIKSGTDRKPITKDDPSSADADIVTSPLPVFEQTHLLSYIGQSLNEVTSVDDVTIVAGCTGQGQLALGSGIYAYFVYGFGEGKVGFGSDEGDWGSAFIPAPPIADALDPDV
jgi:hypothetical protein